MLAIENLERKAKRQERLEKYNLPHDFVKIETTKGTYLHKDKDDYTI